MKPLAVVGWILFTLEVVFVLSLFAQKNMGDDAAGRGLATGWAIILAPIVLGAGALMLWGQRGGHPVAFAIGLVIVGSPLLVAGWQLATGTVSKMGRAAYRSGAGKFEDARLTRLARAIDRGNHAEIGRILAEGPVDATARDRHGRTILGHAIVRATAYDVTPGIVESVDLLLKAGIPPADGIVAPERTSASPEEHLTLITIIGSAGERARAVLDLMLSAGLGTEGVDMDGRPVLFSTYLDQEELAILLRHGANPNALDTRSDMLGWSALMNRVQLGEWGSAVLLLEKGADPDHRSADGTTVDRILAEKGDADPAFTAALARARQERAGRRDA